MQPLCLTRAGECLKNVRVTEKAFSLTLKLLFKIVRMPAPHVPEGHQVFKGLQASRSVRLPGSPLLTPSRCSSLCNCLHTAMRVPRAIAQLLLLLLLLLPHHHCAPHSDSDNSTDPGGDSHHNL